MNLQKSLPKVAEPMNSWRRLHNKVINRKELSVVAIDSVRSSPSLHLKPSNIDGLVGSLGSFSIRPAETEIRSSYWMGSVGSADPLAMELDRHFRQTREFLSKKHLIVSQNRNVQTTLFKSNLLGHPSQLV